MNDIKTSITINITIDNIELISEVNTICDELSLSLEQFISYSINKLIYDIRFVHAIRNIENKEL
ncbi:hypothetical protein [Clostridium guangxiense]|uniref:hypothetical protein n=1 Tax=Clostridium guangxiense TaxID=1662055 RepID=UPI001E2AE481|nr:hypothetical protein [Clostridium guangxiense]MCD2346855.1 hypothetical protein [Clostridium guangxiense]